MAYQGIGTGTTPNDNTGDSLFTGAVKINSNFSEIYNALGDGSNINLSKSRTITAGSGLSGGGDLSANITLNVGQGDGISVSTDTVAVDSTVIRTSGGQTIAGTLNVNGGSVTSGDALVIQNGGDLRLYNSGNAGSARLYCDTNGVINVGTNLTVDGSITSGIFYDSANPGYYLDPASTSSLNSIILTGTLSLNTGPATSGDALVIQNGGDLRLYNSGNAGSSRLYCDTNGVINVDGSITSGIFNSTISTGTAPFTVSSSTKVTNLNADLLDGIDSSRVVYGDSETKTSINDDWNSTLSSGFYNQFGPSGAGTPTETWYHMICCRHPNSSNNYQMQISGDIFDVNNLYYRIINNNSPTSWYKIWHSNNDGSGSGLDADLLDGLQSSSANTGSTIVARDGSGNFSAGTITATTFSGNLANTLTLNTSGTGLSGSTTFNNSGASTFTVTSNATSANTGSTIVARDGSGNFSAGTITATSMTVNGPISALSFGGNLNTPFQPTASVSDKTVTNLEVLSGVYYVRDFYVPAGVTCYLNGVVYIMAQGNVLIDGIVRGEGEATNDLFGDSSTTSGGLISGNVIGNPGSGVAGGTCPWGGKKISAITSLMGSAGATGNASGGSIGGSYAMSEGGKPGQSFIVRSSGSIIQNGTIDLDGQGGISAENSVFKLPGYNIGYNLSGAGGGSGGVLIFDANYSCINNGTIYARGGNGADGYNGGHGGGGGGGGIVIVQSRLQTSILGTVDVNGGGVGVSPGTALGSGGGGGCGGKGGNGAYTHPISGINYPQIGGLGYKSTYGTPW